AVPILGAVPQALLAALPGAVRTAEDAAIGFDAMADDRRLTGRAAGRQGADRAFKAVEAVAAAAVGNLEGLVVVIAAFVADCHGPCLSFFAPAPCRPVCAGPVRAGFRASV